MLKLIASVFAATLLFQAGGIALAQMSHGSADKMKEPMKDMAKETTGVRVSKAWARATVSKAHAGAAYVTIANGGAASDKLVSVSTPAAGRAEMHTTIKDGDIMRMRAVEHIEIGPKAMVTLQPGGVHIMLMDLKAPLKEGTTFPMTLIFEKAGETTVEVAVQSIAAKGMDHGAHGGTKR